MLGWIGNILLIVGYILAGRKRNLCWYFTFFGCSAWLIYGCYLQMWDIIFIEAVCATIALRNIYLWRKKQ